MAVVTSRQEGDKLPFAASIVIPLYNQVDYTRTCLESLQRTVPPDVEIILVNNASTDGTEEYLATLTGISIVKNRENLGFAGACNRGIQEASGEWIVVMNNDVILSSGWLQGLWRSAKRFQLDMVSPAIREGVLNYDVEENARILVGRMSGVLRRGMVSGICFMSDRRVFDAIGVFDENYRIGQYEDKDLFLRATKAGFKLGVVGGAFLHHFGSITQKSIKPESVAKPYALENKAYFIKKWKLSWWQRALERNRDNVVNWFRSNRERLQFGHTLMEKWIDGKLRYF